MIPHDSMSRVNAETSWDMVRFHSMGTDVAGGILHGKMWGYPIW